MLVQCYLTTPEEKRTCPSSSSHSQKLQRIQVALQCQFPLLNCGDGLERRNRDLILNCFWGVMGVLAVYIALVFQGRFDVHRGNTQVLKVIQSQDFISETSLKQEEEKIDD